MKTHLLLVSLFISFSSMAQESKPQQAGSDSSKTERRRPEVKKLTKEQEKEIKKFNKAIRMKPQPGDTVIIRDPKTGEPRLRVIPAKKQ